jgi:hypothetical protein
MLLFVAATAGLMTAYVFIAPNFDPSLGYTMREVMAGLLGGLVALAAGLTGQGLLRRRSKARVSALVLCLALVGLAAWSMLDAAVFTPSNHGSEVAYVLMGGLMWISGGIAATVALAAPTARASFEEPPGGWYPDPLGEGRWRIWDGHRWTEQIG